MHSLWIPYLHKRQNSRGFSQTDLGAWLMLICGLLKPCICYDSLHFALWGALLMGRSRADDWLLSRGLGSPSPRGVPRGWWGTCGVSAPRWGLLGWSRLAWHLIIFSVIGISLIIVIRERTCCAARLCQGSRVVSSSRWCLQVLGWEAIFSLFTQQSQDQ